MEKYIQQCDDDVIKCVRKSAARNLKVKDKRERWGKKNIKGSKTGNGKGVGKMGN